MFWFYPELKIRIVRRLNDSLNACFDLYFVLLNVVCPRNSKICWFATFVVKLCYQNFKAMNRNCIAESFDSKFILQQHLLSFRIGSIPERSLA